MKDNKEILGEAFFKKPSYSDRLKKLLPEYEPDDAKKSGTVGFAVSDPNEVKKRLMSSFGAIVGNNTVKTMASKAIKTFPIVISDNVDPEVSLMIKRLVEEQYASYVELLISNQIIDASQFAVGSDGGNIAIQALDNISGADFSKRQGLATKADRGDLGIQTVAKNDLLYNLLRQESFAPKTADEFTNALLEDALILPSDKADILVDYFAENLDSITEDIVAENLPLRLQKEVAFEYPDEDSKTGKYKKESRVTFDNYVQEYSKAKGKDFGRARDDNSGLLGSDINTPELWVDEKKMDDQVNKRVKDILDANPALKDRFEKATFLLYSYRITGNEYLAYVTQRLGIPVSEKTRRELLVKYRADNLRSLEDRVEKVGDKYERIYTDHKTGGKFRRGDKERFGGLFTGREVAAIANNVHLDQSSGIYGDILKMTYKDAIAGLAIGGTAGGIGVAIAGATGAAMALPFVLAGAIPALVGAGAYFIARYISIKKKNRRMREVPRYTNTVYGWERVESLINIMDMQRKDVQKAYEYATGLRDQAPDILASSEDLDNAIKKAGFGFVLREDERLPYKDLPDEERAVDPMVVPYNLTESIIKETIEDVKETMNELREDREYKAIALDEAIISTTVPVRAVKKYEWDSKATPDLQVVPDYAIGNKMAYGSVEYDTKQIKDRRYNQPLMMKVSFRQRFDDGRLSDNEMTAVIGILGVVTTIPSEDMKEVLKSNAEGQTIEGILKPADGDKQSITNLFGLAKRPNKVSKLQSSELWNNLEKISKLAVVNKLVGRHNNNISNVHLIFSQKEVDDVKTETGIDYLRDKKLTAQLMKRYSAFSIMICNDPGERLYVFDDLDQYAYNVVPYSALRSKDSSDQLTAALMKISDRR